MKNMIYFILMLVCLFTSLVLQSISMWLVLTDILLMLVFGFLMILNCKN